MAQRDHDIVQRWDEKRRNDELPGVIERILHNWPDPDDVCHEFVFPLDDINIDEYGQANTMAFVSNTICEGIVDAARTRLDMRILGKVRRDDDERPLLRTYADPSVSWPDPITEVCAVYRDTVLFEARFQFEPTRSERDAFVLFNREADEYAQVLEPLVAASANTINTLESD